MPSLPSLGLRPKTKESDVTPHSTAETAKPTAAPKAETKSYLTSIRTNPAERGIISKAMGFVRSVWNAIYGVFAKAISYLFCQCFCKESSYVEEMKTLSKIGQFLNAKSLTAEQRAEYFETLPKEVKSRIRVILREELGKDSVTSNELVEEYSHLIKLVASIYSNELMIEELEKSLPKLGDEKQNQRLIQELIEMGFEVSDVALGKPALEEEIKSGIESGKKQISHKRKDMIRWIDQQRPKSS